MVVQKTLRCLPLAVVIVLLEGSLAGGEDLVRRIDVGASGDEPYLVDGFHQHEGPNRTSKIPLAASDTFRWATNRFSLQLPVTPGRHNEVTFRAYFGGPMIVSVGDCWRSVVTGMGAARKETTFVLPAHVVGDAKELKVECRAIYLRRPGAKDKRTLFLILAEVLIRPLDELPESSRIDAVALPPPPEDHRDCLRNVERRPSVSDPVAYAELLAAERANVVTLGTMNGHGMVFFPTELAAVDPRMAPDYLPTVIDELRKRDLHVMSWVVFNAQDVRNTDDFQPIKRFPQWQMHYIDEPGVKQRSRVGMCVVSSPYIEHHGRVLQQAAAFDIDGFFFDGFYLGGIPHPARPGCVCEFCQKKVPGRHRAGATRTDRLDE